MRHPLAPTPEMGTEAQGADRIGLGLWKFVGRLECKTVGSLNSLLSTTRCVFHEKISEAWGRGRAEMD